MKKVRTSGLSFIDSSVRIRLRPALPKAVTALLVRGRLGYRLLWLRTIALIAAVAPCMGACPWSVGRSMVHAEGLGKNSFGLEPGRLARLSRL